MTLDKQLDRTASPLAFVSDQNYPENLEHDPVQPVADEQDAAEASPKPAAPPTNAFEGFGSFSG